jgi:hypothetical protein
VPASPQLSARPTGKLARRRRQAPDSPTPARAVAVPAPRASRHALSRSVPDTVKFRGFPVCDDLSDAEDTAAVLFPPATPRKANPLAHFDGAGPRTAPPCTPFGGVFDMSSDEDATTPSDERGALLFGLTPVSPKGSPAARARKAREQQIKDDFFANSQFQNSPDPEDLPAPAF